MNYQNEESIPIDKSVPLVNQFINSTSHLLNQFSDLYESKIFELDQNLDEIEITLSIYEEKMNSLPQSLFDNLQVDYAAAVQPTTVNLNQHNEQMDMTGNTTMMENQLGAQPQNAAPPPPAGGGGYVPPQVQAQQYQQYPPQQYGQQYPPAHPGLPGYPRLPNRRYPPGPRTYNYRQSCSRQQLNCP